MLIIGSRALKQAGEQYLSSAKRSWDHDMVCSYTEYLSKKKELGRCRTYPVNRGNVIVARTKTDNYEFEIAWDGSTAAKLLEIIKDNPSLVIRDGEDVYASPDLIFTLKKSHRFLRNSPAFIKTWIDYHHLLSLDCAVPSVLDEWYKERIKETYWYTHPKLDVSKDEFFKDVAIPYCFDHDSIHEAMKHLDKPAYDYFKPDNKEVMCSKEMFFACDEKIRLYSVLEESYVLALERSQIPLRGKVKPKDSFVIALQKVCSSITSGFYRQYSWNNYFKVLNMYDDTYVERFWQAVNSGKVKKI